MTDEHKHRVLESLGRFRNRTDGVPEYAHRLIDGFVEPVSNNRFVLFGIRSEPVAGDDLKLVLTLTRKQAQDLVEALQQGLAGFKAGVGNAT